MKNVSFVLQKKINWTLQPTQYYIWGNMEGILYTLCHPHKS